MKQTAPAKLLKMAALLVEQDAWHEYVALQEIQAYAGSLKRGDSRWFYKSPAEWQEMFPFWSLALIENILANLVCIGYLETMTGRAGSASLCYRINPAVT